MAEMRGLKRRMVRRIGIDRSRCDPLSPLLMLDASLPQSVQRIWGNGRLLWMNYRRGYDLTSMRRIETELERQNRVLREENELLKHDKCVLTEALRGVVA